jgi:CheY-like chemotaxis protein
MSEQTILLVDDDPEIVKTVQRYLQHEGYAVLVAYNGVDVLDFVREQTPDCIVLDVMLPDYNGWEITERIRGNPRTAKIPIIMLTTRVEVEVADDGDGITAERLPYVFDRFYRADPSRSRETGGSGLGLSVSRAFVEAHGGTITATREGPGQGTAIHFELPMLRYYSYSIFTILLCHSRSTPLREQALHGKDNFGAPVIPARFKWESTNAQMDYRPMPSRG